MKLAAHLEYADDKIVVNTHAVYSPEAIILPSEATNAQTVEFLNVISNIVVEPHHLVVKAFEDAFGVPFEEEGAECEKTAGQA